MRASRGVVEGGSRRDEKVSEREHSRHLRGAASESFDTLLSKYKRLSDDYDIQ
jgi:hypothetical protein